MNKSSDVICVKNTTNFIKGVKYKAIKLYRWFFRWY